MSDEFDDGLGIKMLIAFFGDQAPDVIASQWPVHEAAILKVIDEDIELCKRCTFPGLVSLIAKYRRANLAKAIASMDEMMQLPDDPRAAKMKELAKSIREHLIERDEVYALFVDPGGEA